MQSGVIEVAPLAYMRGRTLNDSFIILDEAQNTTPEQMKMFLTRLGFGSKMVITGDVTQVDLPGGKNSGLATIRKILDGVDDISFMDLTAEDVVRHHLISDIVSAYEAYDEAKRLRCEWFEAYEKPATFRPAIPVSNKNYFDDDGRLLSTEYSNLRKKKK